MPRTHLAGRMALIGAAALVAASCAPQAVGPAAAGARPETVAERGEAEQRLGDTNHAEIVEKFGGVYDDPELAAYVSELGHRLAAVSEQPREKWTFTVLDSPTVNAFALPGGYVYVTRGLVALANSEAELAGVIGHEVGHVTAGHSVSRQTRGAVATGLLLGAQILGAIAGVDPGLLQAGSAVGQIAAGGILADYSRADELAADNLGVRYLARAGYDPYAQADFLESMSASAALDARMAGQAYNPNATHFLATHPATGQRTRQAIEVAKNSGEPIPVGAQRHRDRLLAVVEGIAWGDSAEQGFVRGRSFSHPLLGFSYSSPAGFTIANSAAAVTAIGPDNARFILDGAPNPAGSLDAYVARDWIPQIAREFPIGRPDRVIPRRINGLEAASTVLPIEIGGRRFDALLVAIRHDGRLYRLAGLAPQGSGLLDEMERAAETFRPLSPAEAATLRQTRIELVTVRPGDTVASLAQGMNVGEFREERFRVLNALGPNETIQPGQQVKIVR
jgi:predicted Zn-dependent protease